ncbi:MAG: hypothetical protein EYC70_00790 [Planctomycetota bacterium]|nr:MAG: hypothetical protein EYC70_00790 [Planctomycetota bacterium]
MFLSTTILTLAPLLGAQEPSPPPPAAEAQPRRERITPEMRREHLQRFLAERPQLREHLRQRALERSTLRREPLRLELRRHHLERHRRDILQRLQRMPALERSRQQRLPGHLSPQQVDTLREEVRELRAELDALKSGLRGRGR